MVFPQDVFVYYSFTGPFGEIPDDLHEITDWWKTIVARDVKPTRGSVGFRDLRGWHSNVTLSEILPDQSDMSALIVGDEVSHIFNGRLTKGTVYKDVFYVSEEDQKTHIQQIASGYIAVNTAANTLRDGTRTRISCVDLPLFDAAKSDISHVLTIYNIRHSWGKRVSANLAAAEYQSPNFRSA